MKTSFEQIAEAINFLGNQSVAYHYLKNPTVSEKLLVKYLFKTSIDENNFKEEKNETV
jgi:hypothetical protein